MNQNRNKWDVFFQKLGESFRKKQGEAMDLRVYQRIKHRKKRILLCIAAVLLLTGALAAMLHVAQTYQKLGDGWTDVNGTIYEPFGKNLLKYSPDAISPTATIPNSRMPAIMAIVGSLINRPAS